MKVLPTTQRPFKWFFTFILALFLFSTNSLQAQNYVSSDVAKSRLATKADQLDQQLEQGSISQTDHSINMKFLKYVLNEIENDDYVWNPEINSKLTTVYQDVLEIANSGTLQTYPQDVIKINTIQEELDTLLQQ